MAERFEFEVVASDGSIVGNDSAASSSSPSGNSTPSAREQRQEENQQLRREAAQRAAQRESDRRADRAERNKRRSSIEERQREENLLRFRQSAHRRKLAQERSIIAEENRGQVQRRRFINNFFGAFNHAHFGRRINHAIDFVQSLFGNNGAAGPSSDPATLQQTSRFLSREVVRTTANSNTERNNSSSKSSRTKDIVRDVTRDRIRDRIALRRSGGVRQQFSRVSSRVGPIRAAQLTGGRFLRTALTSVGRFASSLGKLGPVGLAVGAGFLAVTGGALAAAGAFVVLNRMTGRLIKSIEGIPSPVLFAQLDTQFEILTARFQRADRLGEGLARIERIQGQNTVRTFGLVDNISSPLLPVTEALNRVTGIGLDFLNILVAIDSKIGILNSLENLGNTLNFILDKIDSLDGKAGNISEDLIKLIAPSLLFIGRALGFLDDQKDQKDLGSGAIMRDLFQAMNNPVGDIDAPFEVNVGPEKFKNVFEGL